METETDLGRAVLKFLIVDGGGSQGELRKRYELTKEAWATWWLALSHLRALGLVERCGRGVRGDPFVYKAR